MRDRIAAHERIHSQPDAVGVSISAEAIGRPLAAAASERTTTSPRAASRRLAPSLNPPLPFKPFSARRLPCRPTRGQKRSPVAGLEGVLFISVSLTSQGRVWLSIGVEYSTP